MITDFEKLNNAIVRAAPRSKWWSALADDWYTNVFEKRAWKAAIPGYWFSVLAEYWSKYNKLYQQGVPYNIAADPRVANPQTLRPELKNAGDLPDDITSSEVHAQAAQAARNAVSLFKEPTAELAQEAARRAAEEAAKQFQGDALVVGLKAALGVVAVLGATGLLFLVYQSQTRKQ